MDNQEEDEDYNSSSSMTTTTTTTNNNNNNNITTNYDINNNNNNINNSNEVNFNLISERIIMKEDVFSILDSITKNDIYQSSPSITSTAAATVSAAAATSSSPATIVASSNYSDTLSSSSSSSISSIPSLDLSQPFFHQQHQQQQHQQQLSRSNSNLSVSSGGSTSAKVKSKKPNLHVVISANNNNNSNSNSQPLVPIVDESQLNQQQQEQKQMNSDKFTMQPFSERDISGGETSSSSSYGNSPKCFTSDTSESPITPSALAVNLDTTPNLTPVSTSSQSSVLLPLHKTTSPTSNHQKALGGLINHKKYDEMVLKESSFFLSTASIGSNRLRKSDNNVIKASDLNLGFTTSATTTTIDYSSSPALSPFGKPRSMTTALTHKGGMGAGGGVGTQNNSQNYYGNIPPPTTPNRHAEKLSKFFGTSKESFVGYSFDQPSSLASNISSSSSSSSLGANGGSSSSPSLLQHAAGGNLNTLVALNDSSNSISPNSSPSTSPSPSPPSSPTIAPPSSLAALHLSSSTLPSTTTTNSSSSSNASWVSGESPAKRLSRARAATTVGYSEATLTRQPSSHNLLLTPPLLPPLPQPGGSIDRSLSGRDTHSKKSSKMLISKLLKGNQQPSVSISTSLNLSGLGPPISLQTPPRHSTSSKGRSNNNHIVQCSMILIPNGETLSMVLKERSLYEAFRSFCEKEHALNNLLFIEDVEEFQQSTPSSDEGEEMERIYQKYLAPDAPNELSFIDKKLLTSIFNQQNQQNQLQFQQHLQQQQQLQQQQAEKLQLQSQSLPQSPQMAIPSSTNTTTNTTPTSSPTSPPPPPPQTPTTITATAATAVDAVTNSPTQNFDQLTPLSTPTSSHNNGSILSSPPPPSPLPLPSPSPLHQPPLTPQSTITPTTPSIPQPPPQIFNNNNIIIAPPTSNRVIFDKVFKIVRDNIVNEPFKKFCLFVNNQNNHPTINNPPPTPNSHSHNHHSHNPNSNNNSNSNSLIPSPSSASAAVAVPITGSSWNSNNLSPNNSNSPSPSSSPPADVFPSGVQHPPFFNISPASPHPSPRNDGANSSTAPLSPRGERASHHHHHEKSPVPSIPALPLLQDLSRQDRSNSNGSDGAKTDRTLTSPPLSPRVSMIRPNFLLKDSGGISKGSGGLSPSSSTTINQNNQQQTYTPIFTDSENEDEEREDDNEEYGIAFGFKRGPCNQPCDCMAYKPKGNNGGACQNCGHYPASHKNLGKVQQKTTHHQTLDLDDMIMQQHPNLLSMVDSPLPSPKRNKIDTYTFLQKLIIQSNRIQQQQQQQQQQQPKDKEKEKEKDLEQQQQQPPTPVSTSTTTSPSEENHVATSNDKDNNNNNNVNEINNNNNTVDENSNLIQDNDESQQQGGVDKSITTTTTITTSTTSTSTSTTATPTSSANPTIVNNPLTTSIDIDTERLLINFNNWSIDGDEVVYLNKLGEGTSAKVYKAIWRNQEVAAKILKNAPENQKLLDFLKELEIMSSLRSPHVVYFYGMVIQPKICMIMEYCSNQSLYHLMHTSMDFTWDWVLKFSIEMVKGIVCLHNWKPAIVHRDLKSLNLLVSDNWTIKVADFGLSRFATSKAQSIRKTRGTYAYCAPEVYYGDYTMKGDIFSIGIIIWELVVRCMKGKYERPFSEFKQIQYDFQILIQTSKYNIRPTIPANCPESISNLITLCWEKDPEKRPTSTEILENLQSLNKIYENDKDNRKRWERVREKLKK